MKRALSLFAMGLLCLISLPVCAEELIKIGYFPNKPFIYPNEATGKPQGAVVKYLEAVAEKMGYAVEWIGPLPLVRYATALKEGTVDVAAFIVKLPETEELVYYSDQPLGLPRPVLIVRKDSPLTQITSIDDVKGLRIGWYVNISPSKFVQEHIESFQMDYMPLAENAGLQSLEKLLLGRVDALHELNAYSLPFLAAEHGLLDQIKVLPLPEPANSTYVGFSKTAPRGRMLLEQFNAAQAALGFTPEVYTQFIQEEFDAIAKP